MKKRPTAILILSFTIGNLFAAPLNATNHWVANTSGTVEGHINNFIVDMSVWYNPDPQGQEQPLILVGSFWDEGSCGYCAYHDGKQVGKAEWYKEHMHSQWVVRNLDTCRIENFWGRAFLYKNYAPPTGINAPFVGCSTGDTIRSVIDPSALAFDMQGRLLIADNGPDQNVKIFDLSGTIPQLVRTFGDSGGVFAGPIPGKAGIRRFWGIRGLGVDSLGNVYVGNTGIPMQTMGGTDIRVFSGADSSLLWQVQGLSFVNSADADPATDGKDLYLNAKHFTMDYTQIPGQSWKLAGVTLDPFKYPQDPRIVTPMESVWERRIEGKRFQYHTNMVGGFVYVLRFNEDSEIGIPTAFFCTYQDFNVGVVDSGAGAGQWLNDSIPTWERNETNKRLRWYWVDRNGDGRMQKVEFGTYDNYNMFSQGLDVDENGDIWTGGSGLVSTYFRGGGITRIVAGKLDANGVPEFNMNTLKRYDIIHTDYSGSAIRVKHLAANNSTYLTASSNAWYSMMLYRYDHMDDSTKRTERFHVDLGFDDDGQSEIHLDQNSANMTLPFSFTADTNFIYVTYLDKGLDARVRGEVTVYDAHDGHKVGWLIPGAETGNFAGAVDLVNGINAFTQNDGSELVMVEEDGAGKVMVYRWCPDGAACDNRTSPVTRPTLPRQLSQSRPIRWFNLLGQAQN